MQLITIKYDGGDVQVEIKPCRHCNVVPTAADAAQAVAHERKTIKSCAVCGGKPKMYRQYALYHSVDCDGKGGFRLCGSDAFTDPTWDPEWLTTFCTGPGGTVDAAFHRACFLKVAPGATIHPR